MNRYLSFFLIFAIAFVLLPYIATVETRRETSPAFAQITDGTENGSEALSAVGKDDEIICRLCTLSDYIKSDESIKAAAVALRTKALYDKNNRLSAEDNGFYGLAEPTKSDCIRIYGKDTVEKIEKIVEACDGLIVTYNGAPIDAQMHMISSGMTESIGDAEGEQIPYLKSVAADADKNAGGYITERKFSVSDVRNILEKEFGKPLPDTENEWITEIKRTKAGAVIGAKVGENSADGETLRRIFGLRSPNFSYRIKNGEFIFTVKGYGNLAGMSLYGAEAMAKEGMTFEQILAYYYSGTETEYG